ncbi:MAG TPA: glycosyltransferase family 39 protein [Vicinamibacterales bacterium]|nr:glycosyltransferase family 39 protein [Vicinamibacterales bacterium]
MRSAVPSLHASDTPAWVLTLWRTPWLWLALVITLFSVPLFFGLGRTDFENDEAIYSFAAEVMVKDGDWLTPKSAPSETDAFLEKPPLKIWMVAAPIYFGWLPANEFGERFADALMGGLAFLYVFGIGRKLAGPVAGFAAAALLFALDALIFSHGVRTNNMESAVLLAYCGGVYHFLAWRSVNPDVKRHIVAMSLYFVLGFMTKFVAAIFLPAILVLAAASTRQDLGRVKRDWPMFVLAALLALLLIAPWFVYQYMHTGPPFIAKIFGEHVMKRFTAYLDPAHLHPWNYYFIEIWKQLGRAGVRTICVAGALLLLWRAVRERSTAAVVVILWFGLPLGVISTTTSKLVHYAYPFLPPIALAGGIATAWIATQLYRILERPIDAFAGVRRRLLGRVADVHAWQVAATVAGLGALVLSAVTFGFERLSLHLGAFVARNSSAARPALTGAAVLLLGAPAAIVRALAVLAILLLVLPVKAYHENAMRTSVSASPYRDIRDCLAPIVANEVAHGKAAPGMWIEAREISHMPFYYFRGLGPWQHRSVASNQTVVMHLVVPERYRPVILSEERYGEVLRWLANDREAALGRASVLSGVDVATLNATFDRAVLGITPIQNLLLVMPGPYASCGVERLKLGSR